MSQDSAFRTIGVATGICLFCSLFVSVAAVKLAPRQAEEKQKDKIKNILQVANLDYTDADAKEIYQERIKPVLIDLATGQTLKEDQYDDKLNPTDFDLKVLSGNPKYSEEIPADQDIVGIQRRPKDMIVYLLMEGDTLAKVILPIHGKGLWSTMYGFLALEKDLKTVSGVTFYEHGETPGLGGEVDNPNWKASWKDKQAFDDDSKVVIKVIKGQVIPGTPGAERQIDGLSGATLTTRGIDNVVQYWLGEHGYGPFLKQLREEK